MGSGDLGGGEGVPGDGYRVPGRLGFLRWELGVVLRITYYVLRRVSALCDGHSSDFEGGENISRIADMDET